MRSLEELLREAEVAHGHLCAGQVLGVRMAMLGCRMLGIDEPRAGDGSQAAGDVCGDRPLRDGRDWGGDGMQAGQAGAEVSRLGEDGGELCGPGASGVGGVEAVAGGRAVRIAALESSKERAREMYPHIEGKNAQQMLAYRELPDEELFRTEWVRGGAACAGDAGVQVGADCVRRDAGRGLITTARW